MQLQRISKLIEQKQTHASLRPALQPHAQKHLLLQLQQAVGNQAFLQLMRSGVLQTKLEVRKPGDVNELVAEQLAQLAQRVIRTRGPDEKSDNEFLVEAKETPLPVTEVPPTARRRLRPSRDGGQPKRAANVEKASALQTKKESESLPDVDKGAAKETAAEAAVAKETPPPPAIPGEEKEGAAEAPQGKGLTRTPATPAEDPAFQEAKKHVRTEAKKQKKHDLPDVKRAETEKASALKEDEQIDQSSKEKSTEEMRRVGAEQQNEVKNFSAQKFKDDLMVRINAKRPETESEAKAFAKEQPVEHFEADFSNEVAKEQGKVTRPLEEKAQPKPTGGVAEKPIVEVPKPAFPAAPKPVDPKLATPKPKTDQEISLKHESDRLDGAMQENDLSDDQLAESREPSFIETLKTKEEAKKKVAEAPDVYRQREAEILKKAEGDTNDSLATELGGMSKVHQKIGGDVHGGQKKTETETEKRQREIKETIDGIYQGTVEAVKGILADMVSKVKDDFASALNQQTDIFNENVRKRISNYYGNWRIDDKLFGPADVVVLPNGKTRPMTLEEAFGAVKNKKTINPDVYEIFVEEKDAFLKAMDLQLDIIANNVQAGLTAAHNQIQIGKTAIAIFKATLKGSELIYATSLEEEVKVKFENLESSIDDAREDLLQTLAEQYSENVNQLEKTFNEINDELKKSWLDRAIEFIETVAKTIFQLAELLLSILVRVAHLVWDIIKHPIRFFETLVSGLKEGIGKFIDNIGTYLQEAFWTWITGTTPAKNIRLSSGSGIESLFDLVMQVLNLGPAELRAIVEKILGKEFMEMVDKAMDFGEKALEPVIILLKEGPLAFWRYIQDTLGSIIQSSFDRIKETVFDAFVEKGLKWIAGFFIPGGGFVKIVKAIVSAFQFVAENLENIRHFFDSVFDAMEAAVAGRTEGVVSKIITGLKTGVVLALDFLAKQLGLSKIIDSVQKIIQSLRRPIVNAIEWILRKVKPLVTKLMAKGMVLVEKGKQVAIGAGKKILGWLGLRKKFTDNKGGNHEIYFKGIQSSAQLYVSSYNPRTVHTLLTAVSKIISQPKNNQYQQSYQDAVILNGQIATIRNRLVKPDNPTAEKDNEEMNNKMGELATKLPPLMTMVGGTQPPPLLKPSFANKVKASNFEVFYLKSGRTSGGSPAEDNSGATLTGWPRISRAGLSAKAAWVKMHLLHEELGGPALDSNLTPARGSQTNQLFYRKVEKDAIAAVNNDKTIWYKVIIGYHGAPNDDYVNNIAIEWGPYRFNDDNEQWEKKEKGTVIDGEPVGGEFSQNPEPPDFSGAVVLHNLNDPLIGWRTILNLAKGLDRPFAEFVVQVRLGPPPFKNEDDMVSRLERAYKQRIIPIENFVAQVKALKAEVNNTYSIQ